MQSSAAIIWQAALAAGAAPAENRRLDDRPRYSHGHKHTNVNAVSCAGFNRTVNAWRRSVVGNRASGLSLPDAVGIFIVANALMIVLCGVTGLLRV